MPYEVRVAYHGNRQCEVTHLPSGDVLAIGPRTGPTFSLI